MRFLKKIIFAALPALLLFSIYWDVFHIADVFFTSKNKLVFIGNLDRDSLIVGSVSNYAKLFFYFLLQLELKIIVLSILPLVVFGILFIFYDSISRQLNLTVVHIFIKRLFDNRWMIWQLVKREFKEKYTASLLGSLWLFIHPLVVILVLWFAFEYGLRIRKAPDSQAPFVIWLMCGIIPWFFLSEALLNATASIAEKSYLVKKVLFPVPILPIIKILTSLAVHLFLVFVLLLLLLKYRMGFSVFYIQIIYYVFASFFFLLGLSWLTSSVSIFWGDAAQIINVIIQIGFWLTPIIWSVSIIPEHLGIVKIILKLNPAYYIIEGYRDAIINQVWFWQRINSLLFFWILTGLIWIVGIVTFRKLRPHFADVL